MEGLHVLDYPNELNEIFDKFKEFDIRPVLVGGYVRDYIINSNLNTKYFLTKDIDIELYNAPSFEKIEKILSEFGNPNYIGKNFGVIKLKLDNLEIDFSMPRTENKISSGHKGFKVETDSKLSFKTAASRRDFTINAIGYDIFSKKLLDPYDGIKDLKNKKLKMVNKHSFVEDPLRVLRAMQFCARFELKPNKKLVYYCYNMCHNKLLDELPKERIYEEFKKLFLRSNKPSIGLEFLKHSDALVFFSELYMSKDDWIKILKYIDNVDKTKLSNENIVIVMLAILCYKMDKANIESFINKLTDQRSILRIIDSLYHIDNFINGLSSKTTKNISIKYAVAKDIDIDILMTYLSAKETPRNILEKVYKIKPIVAGKDLIDVGLRESQNFNSLLQSIYDIQLKKLFT